MEDYLFQGDLDGAEGSGISNLSLTHMVDDFRGFTWQLVSVLPGIFQNECSYKYLPAVLQKLENAFYWILLIFRN